MKKIVLLLMSLTLVLTACLNTVDDEDENGSTIIGPKNGIKFIEKNNIRLEWQIEGVDLKVTLSAPTIGWISVGFDPTQGMQDANFIIGFVQSNTASARDDFGLTQTSHAADVDYGGTDNLTGVSGTEADGRTEIAFTIPLNSGDARDRILTVGQTYTVILAYGGADNFNSYHTLRTAATITL